MVQFLQQINLEVIGYILLFPIFFVWLLWIIHTTIDITRRTDSLLVEFCCILLAAFLWPLGWLLYLVFRPYNTLLEKQVYNSIIANSQECLECGWINNINNHYCVNCGAELKIKCKECKKEYYKWYEFCPYCSAPNIELD